MSTSERLGERFDHRRASPRRRSSGVTTSRFVKRVTHKPVVGVGRFTSPDTHGRVRFVAACSISSAPHGPRSPIPSCRGRSRKGGSKTSANASVATSASAATTRWHRCVAPRIQPWARSGARAGIRRRSRPRSLGRAACSSSARDRRVWSARLSLSRRTGYRVHARRGRQGIGRPRTAGSRAHGTFGMGSRARLPRRAVESRVRASRSSWITG